MLLSTSIHFLYSKTNNGKIMTMIYAIFGIPLMLLCLANIGSTMADAFRFIYCNVYIFCKDTSMNITFEGEGKEDVLFDYYCRFFWGVSCVMLIVCAGTYIYIFFFKGETLFLY